MIKIYIQKEMRTSRGSDFSLGDGEWEEVRLYYVCVCTHAYTEGGETKSHLRTNDDNVSWPRLRLTLTLYIKDPTKGKTFKGDYVFLRYSEGRIQRFPGFFFLSRFEIHSPQVTRRTRSPWPRTSTRKHPADEHGYREGRAPEKSREGGGAKGPLWKWGDPRNRNSALCRHGAGAVQSVAGGGGDFPSGSRVSASSSNPACSAAEAAVAAAPVPASPPPPPRPIPRPAALAGRGNSSCRRPPLPQRRWVPAPAAGAARSSAPQLRGPGTAVRAPNVRHGRPGRGPESVRVPHHPPLLERGATALRWSAEGRETPQHAQEAEGWRGREVAR